jgi:hypothetical protein
MRRNISTIVWIVIVLAVAALNWQMGRLYERGVCEREFATELTAKPLGPETVGFKPLQELPILKQIEIRIDGTDRMFVVGEIQTFEVARYGPKGKSELVLDSNGKAVAQIVRATEMNKTIDFTR